MDERALRHGDTGPAVTLTTGGSGGNAGDQGSAATGAESGQGAEPTTGGTSGSGGGSGGSSAARGGSSGGSSGSHGGSAGGRAGTSGTGSDAGEGAVGVGTAGVDNSGPCAGEECSCAGLGANDCARQSCCTSLTLPAGTFTLGDGEATIAAFRLDAFEVTVGRFRRFVEAYLRPPAPDSGQNDYVIGSGWMPEWFAQMPLDQAGLRDRLTCDGQTWTDSAGDDEAQPMNCVTWYEAFAFCAWDGGRLPTEAEWEYAAAGGDEARSYPWGSRAPTASEAVFGCELGSACSESMLDAVGSRPDGAARYGQADLAGSLAEWTLDYFAPYSASCDHCANIGDGGERVVRGGSVSSLDAAELRASARASMDPELRDFAHGFRCARAP